MNILITGIGGPTPLGVAKSLKLANENLKIIGTDANKFAPGHFDSTYDKTYVIPKASDKDYWLSITKIIKLEKINFAFIIPETEVIEWSNRQSMGLLPCKTILPDIKVAKFMFDKLKVSNLLEPLNLSPTTVKIDPNDLLNESLKKLDFPFWVRINKTAGALGAMKISENEDFNNWVRIHQNEDFIASDYLPGRNFAAKLFFYKSKLQLTASGERIEYLMPNLSPTKITGMCARGRLINNTNLINKAELAIRKVHEHLSVNEINGMFTVDFKEDFNHNPLITEINIRPVSFIYAFTLGGINFPLEILKLATNSSYNRNRIDFHFKKEYDFIRGVDYPIMLVD
ncbi:hypothetical protein [Psychroflexus sp. ALD_RP9]|uniref:hypothetical protein n=1 Tax=Psychroflexus sp. ALD_RP9 TaxID=2777186 RepID=UPI001A907F4A|nr:hypothetical protein [Psychroflexus sp. ALD_RP9]QSS98019.1 hypothetical protein IMZ30_04710 [Psychroflexus sp. ALD_RP9]